MDKAYLKLDKNIMGYIPVIELQNCYNAAIHPLVQSHKITEKQAMQEFLDHFHRSGKDGIVFKEVLLINKEWYDYYCAVSSTIQKDDHFVQLMITAYRLTN